MKVGFLLLAGGLGGHARSARSIRRALLARGVEVELALSHRSTVLFDEESVRRAYTHPDDARHVILDGRYFAEIERWIGREGVQLLHAFDTRSGLAAYWICQKRNLPFLTTICGSMLRFRYPPARPVVVFSQELKDSLVWRYGFRPEDVHVEPGRLSPADLSAPLDRHEVRAVLGIAPDARVCLETSRVDVSRLAAISYTLEVVERCAAVDPLLVYCLIGTAQDPLCAARLDASIDERNRALGRRAFVWDRERFVREASRALPAADIAIGVGRSAYEAMEAGLPVLVVGLHGFAGLAVGESGRPDPELFYYNMSGRNARGRDVEATGATMAREMSELLSNPERRAGLGAMARAWVRRTLDADRSAALYERLYGELLQSGTGQTRDGILATLPAYLRLTAGEIRQWWHQRAVAGNSPAPRGP